MDFCPYLEVCLNGPSGRDQCFRCSGLHLLKLPRDRIKRKIQRRNRSPARDEVSWRQLEKEVQRKLSQPLTAREYEARQNPGSGNYWARPGDVLHGLLQIEAKERKAEVKGAEKSIRFEKAWLDKCIEEAAFTHKVPVVAFRFKGDDRIYACMPFDNLVELVQELQFLKELKDSGHLQRGLLQMP